MTDVTNLFTLARVLVMALSTAFLAGCAMTRTVQEKPPLPPVLLVKEIERNRFAVEKGDDVIGRLAAVRLEKGDTLPDLARHFSLGINAVSAANPGVDIWVPPAGERIILPLSFILPDAPRKGIVVNVAAMRLFKFKRDGNSLLVSTYPVGVGTKERPTPIGQMRVKHKATQPTWHVPASIAADYRRKGNPLPAKVPPGPENPLGACALYLSKADYLIHGTNKPASIGLQATNGCIRLYPENVEVLYDDTPVNTPVVIVNQPYLIGQRDGVLYLEAHAPLEGAGFTEREKFKARLQAFEKKTGRSFDWRKVEDIQEEARGIPVPILEMRGRSRQAAAEVIELEHPATLYGQPEIPELKLEGWYVLAADLQDEIEARRIAAIVNHQGPPIPARVLSRSNSHRVIAGPFSDAGEAGVALKRLKIDLELDGILLEPVRKADPAVTHVGDVAGQKVISPGLH